MDIFLKPFIVADSLPAEPPDQFNGINYFLCVIVDLNEKLLKRYEIACTALLK